MVLVQLQILGQGLADLRLLGNVSPSGIISSGAYIDFYPHNVGVFHHGKQAVFNHLCHTQGCTLSAAAGSRNIIFIVSLHGAV